MIYLDQAATSFPKIKEVQDAVIDCMNHCTNANRSTSVTSLNASRLIYQTRKLIKEYFHVPQDGCVVLNSGNTESLNTCIKGILKKGDHVITTYAEHNSVLRPLYQLEDVPHFGQYHSSLKYHVHALVFQFQQLDKFHPLH